MIEKSIEEQLKAMTLKMNRLEGEIDSLKKEVASLKKNKSTVSANTAREKAVVQKPVYVPVEQRVPALANKVSEEKVVNTVNSEAFDTVSSPIPNTPVNTMPAKPVKEKASLENRIGKNLMGIVASVLILAALVVFGGIIFIVIPDIVKVAIMYAISFAFAIVGIKKMNKEGKYYALFSAIAATGVSAVYITTLIAYFKFELLPVPVLIAIIIAWLVTTGFLAKKKSVMFMYVCNVGLIISTFLIAFEWSAYYMAAILYVLGLAFIYLLNKSDNYNKDCHVFFQLPIVTLILIAANYDNYIYIMVMFAIVTAVTFLREKIYEINRKNLATYIIGSFLWLIYSLIFAKACERQFNIGEYACFVFVAAISVYTYIFYKRHSNLSRALTYVVYYLWAASFMTANVGVIEEYISFGLVAAVFIIIGCLKKNLHCLIPGYWYLLLFLIIYPTALSTGVVTSLIVLIVAAALYIYNIKNYSIVFKYINTALFVCALSRFCSESSFGEVPSLIVFAALSFFMNTEFYAKNYKTGEREVSSIIVGYVVNFLMMVEASYILCNNTDAFTIFETEVLGEVFNYIIVLLVTIALFSINTKRLFTNALIKEELCAIYIGVKFTVLIINALTRIDALSFVISLALLVFAILCIVLGFKFKFKSVRIYGLVLTLISVIKILIADIEYDNFLLRPLGMLAAGLLCFGISYIYSKLEKKQ